MTILTELTKIVTLVAVRTTIVALTAIKCGGKGSASFCLILPFNDINRLGKCGVKSNIMMKVEFLKNQTSRGKNI